MAFADSPPKWPLVCGIEDFPAVGGAYALAIRLDREIRLPKNQYGNKPGNQHGNKHGRKRVGVPLGPGLYIYAGSANGPGGIRARVLRHFRTGKALHWHVDYLTPPGEIVAAGALPGTGECRIVERVRKIAGASVPIAGFGSSDCTRCPAHLIEITGGGDPLAILKNLGAEPLFWRQ